MINTQTTVFMLPSTALGSHSSHLSNRLSCKSVWIYSKGDANRGQDNMRVQTATTAYVITTAYIATT
ncbi:exported hypothetical protein [Candidatus Nitrospira nitrificans]|uniref:Uncharacterized protein n=1 Tax=Candidatus Nitrospira nitrificans TaxID=1742973 RepID=A0A0S4LR62_9BACT|nr:exported hypothetical protein [Candidatus Nitrospira nitrificans]